MKKLFVKTYGCQMNAYDSAKMADLLAPLGYAATDTPEGADMVILNTCHIRERAVEKVYSELGRLRKMKAQRAQGGGKMLLAVAGCVAQAEGEEIVAREAAVDLVVGPQSYHRLPEMIARAARQNGHALETDFPALEKFDSLMPPRASGVSAFLTVQEGCDKFCTFCVVPYTRGSEKFAFPRIHFGWKRASLRTRARARSCSWARTSMPMTVMGGAWQNCAMPSRRSKPSNASATPPAIPATWATI